VLKTGDRVRIDLNKGDANILIPDDELKRRFCRSQGDGRVPPIRRTRRPWQEIYRDNVGQQSTGACLEFASRYQDIAGTVGVARDNH
jgi:Dihydroxyacid dehydratase/phosphogluconate dehydratase